jgi:hypothetical protein
MQVALMYKLAQSEEFFEKCEDARTEVALVIAEWQLAHRLGHTQSVQPYVSHERSDPPPSMRLASES